MFPGRRACRQKARVIAWRQGAVDDGARGSIDKAEAFNTPADTQERCGRHSYPLGRLVVDPALAGSVRLQKHSGRWYRLSAYHQW